VTRALRECRPPPWWIHRYVRSTRCRTSYSRCIISCSLG